jgi:hypothetical protein
MEHVKSSFRDLHQLFEKSITVCDIGEPLASVDQDYPAKQARKMTDKTLKILLGIIAINLTIQTVKDVGLFPTAYAQSGIQKIAICEEDGGGLWS